MLKKILTILAAIALLLVAILLFTPTMVWCGGFQQAEYQLLFVDEHGSLIEGIEMRVEDQGGLNYYHYPVTDYLEDKAPTSDADGVLTFHHVYFSVEFDGHCQELFGVVHLGECNGPVFMCRFLLAGKEVHRCRFNYLNAKVVESQEKTTRSWTWDDFLPFEYPSNPSAEWLERQREASDRNGNWTRDIGERAAFRAAICAIGKHEDIQRGSVASSAELEFGVYRTKIVVRDKLAVK